MTTTSSVQDPRTATSASTPQAPEEVDVVRRAERAGADLATGVAARDRTGDLPAEVVDRIGQMRDLLHLDTHLVKFDMGGMPHDEVAATIERFGAEVIPQLA